MERQAPSPSGSSICNLADSSKEPTDAQLRKLMHLVGEDGRKSLQSARNIVRERRRQTIASGRERRQAIILSLKKNCVTDA